MSDDSAAPPNRDLQRTIAMIIGLLGTVSLAVMVWQGFSIGMTILAVLLFIIARALYPGDKPPR